MHPLKELLALIIWGGTIFLTGAPEPSEVTFYAIKEEEEIGNLEK